MSTRGYIAVHNGNNVTYNYLHSDNYIVGGTGEKLLRSSKYNSEEGVKKLVTIGDRSYLEKETPYNDQSEVVHTCSIEDWKDILEDSWDIDFIYLWDKNNNGIYEWFVSSDNLPFRPLRVAYIEALMNKYQVKGIVND